jgi:hypothetical protein
MIKYSVTSLKQLLADNDIKTTAKNKTELLFLAYDAGLLTRELVMHPQTAIANEVKEKKPLGRPRKYPPNEVVLDKVVDPKYYRLRMIRTNPTTIKLTNVATGQVTTYGSLYKAYQDTKHGCGFFMRNNGKEVDGILIEVMK